jgi:hypothetical protein
MAQLAGNRPVPATLQQRLDLAGGVVVDMEMDTSVTIYEGALVGYVPGTGTIHALVNADAFAGIALEKKVSDGTAGSTRCKVFTCGFFQHAITSLTVAGVGKVAFATSLSSDNVIDITSNTLPAIGRVVNFVSTGVGIIQMKDCGARAGSSGATVLYLPVEL